MIVIKHSPIKSVLLGNGINIQFGGRAYSNRFIMSRIVFNARCGKYDTLFKDPVSGKEIEDIFRGLLPTANDVLAGKYDNLGIVDNEIIKAIVEFKNQNSNRSRFEHYYDIPLEDWFLLLRLFFLSNIDLIDKWDASKQGFEWMILDAIYNDGKIQDIYLKKNKMNKSVRRFFKSFDSIFTLNYDNNIEKLTKKTVYHLHGDYSVLSDSLNPETVLGFLCAQNEHTFMIPEYRHCFCNALLNFSGNAKLIEAQKKLNFIKELQELKKLWETDTNEFQARLGAEKAEIATSINTYIAHPDLDIATDYHFSELENLSGELHIIGLSPKNDSHIFACIDRSSVDKVIFYYNSKEPKELPLNKPYICESIQSKWKSLNVKTPKYNCSSRSYLNSSNTESALELTNILSFDPITRTELKEGLKATPDFIAAPLCQEAIKLMKLQEKPTEETLEKHFMEVSRIALREGILPPVFYLLLINYMKHQNTEHKT